MADSDPRIRRARAEFIYSMEQAQARLDHALKRRDDIPTQHKIFGKSEITELARDIHNKATELIVASPHIATCALFNTALAIGRDTFSRDPWSPDWVEKNLGRAIDFVFGKPEQPRLAGPKEAMICELDPYTFTYLSLTRFPTKPTTAWSLDSRNPRDHDRLVGGYTRRSRGTDSEPFTRSPAKDGEPTTSSSPHEEAKENSIHGLIFEETLARMISQIPPTTTLNLTR
ncbi:hypothetical protein V8F33_012524 [Rhypophila sp. PSN 637]